LVASGVGKLDGADSDWIFMPLALEVAVNPEGLVSFVTV